MSDDTKTWEGETRSEVDSGLVLEKEKKGDAPDFKEIKFTADPRGLEETILRQDKIIRNLTIQRNMAILLVLFFLIAIIW